MDLPIPKDFEPTVFFEKLYDFLNDTTIDHILHWRGKGTSFFIKNNFQLELKLCPQFYEHCTWVNFCNTLFACGFRKALTWGVEFSHPQFIRSELRNMTRLERQEIFLTELGEKSAKQPVKTLARWTPCMDAELKKLREEVETLKTDTSNLSLKFDTLLDEHKSLSQQLEQLEDKNH